MVYSYCFFFSIENMFPLIINETHDLFFPFNRGQVLDPILAVLQGRVHASVLAFLHLCEYPHMLLLVHGYSTDQIHLKPPGHRPWQTFKTHKKLHLHIICLSLLPEAVFPSDVILILSGHAFVNGAIADAVIDRLFIFVHFRH
jgi:hypothetical protein